MVKYKKNASKVLKFPIVMHMNPRPAYKPSPQGIRTSWNFL